MPLETLLQRDFSVRCEWGLPAVRALAPACDAVVIVDVLSFSTCVDIATARGATIHPFRFADERAAAFARANDALLAGDNALGLSLRPASLLGIEAGTRLVLPSPNGSLLSTETGAVPTIAGCLRNARAVAECAAAIGERILIVPAGERWPDGSLRPALEDLCGAGAIIHHLPAARTRSPDALAAAAVFARARETLFATLSACASGRWKAARDQNRDVDLAAALDVSPCAPVLRDGAFVGGQGSGEPSEGGRTDEGAKAATAS